MNLEVCGSYWVNINIFRIFQSERYFYLCDEFTPDWDRLNRSLWVAINLATFLIKNNFAPSSDYHQKRI